MKRAIFLVMTMHSILACTVKLTLLLNQIERFQISQEKFMDHQAIVCLQFRQFKENSTYTARLDYLPNVGLQAKNDKKMNRLGNSLVAQFQVKQLGLPLDDKQRPFIYNFVVEIRQSIVINDSQYLTFYKTQITQYLPICLIIVASAFWIEKKLWSNYKDKLD